ncbi:hypothetical protein E0Z10_g3539 [Xylaria hypoxylon]|uniref:Uncharacterized protein n=1 Tax=Xylaria hypoxylon TaxID=37992 RepID=A0A4Z0Z1F2_9PEZI|nr:hypothetical protein E0Z10_g3539 [Xylaria hypoxylon]
MDKMRVERMIGTQDDSRGIQQNSLSENDVAVEERPTVKSNASFDDLPFELVVEALSYLDDYKDLIKHVRPSSYPLIICASRLAYSVFRAVPHKLQTQITLNNVEPEALQMALAVFYCTTGREASIPYTPWPGDEPKLQGYPPFEFSFELPFPTQRSEIAKFFFLSKVIQFGAERIVSKSLVHTDRVLGRKESSSVGSVASLTKEVRGRLEKKLYQYELAATALNHDEHGIYGDTTYDFTVFTSSPHRWLAGLLLEGVGSVEFQQLLTVEDLIFDDCWTFERDFHVSFGRDIVEAAKKVKASSLDPSYDPLGAEEVATPIDIQHVCRREGHQYCCAYKWTWFLATLQTFGLKWYKEMQEASPAKRKTLMFHAHKRHRSMQVVPIFRRYRPLGESTEPGYGRDYLRHSKIKLEQVDFPNTYVDKYFETVDRFYPSITPYNSYGDSLLRTGWWLWNDTHLSKIDFGRYQLTDECPKE